MALEPANATVSSAVGTKTKMTSILLTEPVPHLDQKSVSLPVSSVLYLDIDSIFCGQNEFSISSSVRVSVINLPVKPPIIRSRYLEYPSAEHG